MAKTLRIPTRDWYPRKYIKRAGEDYVYVGELPNDPICRKSHRDQAKEQGRNLEPVNKTSAWYRDMRDKCGGDWVTDGLELGEKEYPKVYMQLLKMGRP